MRLAIHGGAPVRDDPFAKWPYSDERDKKYLLEALDQDLWWRVANCQVDQFEVDFAHYHQAKYCLAVTNGTQAIEIALQTLGVGPGDEVIVPGFTFISTSMAVHRLGAKAIPVDVNLDDYCIDVQQVERFITSNTKVIIPVHMAGQIANMESLMDLATKHGVYVLQDAAHAHGAERNGKRVGHYSPACFSFQNFKLMTAGEGGAITFDSKQDYEQAYLIHNCGRPKNDLRYQHTVIGTNARMSEFSAAVLRAQLERLPEQNTLRYQNAKKLFGLLQSLPEVIPQTVHDAATVCPFYMVMFRINRELCPEVSRDKVVEALVAEGVPAFRNYVPIYTTQCFEDAVGDAEHIEAIAARCPNTHSIAFDGIWIHHRVLLGDEQDVADVAAAITKVITYFKKHKA